MADSQMEMALSADVADADERAYWARMGQRLREHCDPLSRIVGRKNIVWATGISEGQLSKEMSGAPEPDGQPKRIAASTLLYVLRHSQDDHLAKLIFCEIGGYRLPEKAKEPLDPAEELKLIKDALSRAGSAGRAIYEDALRARPAPAKKGGGR